MAAANTDKLRKKRSNFSTTLNGGINDTDATIALNSVSGLPTDTGITLTINRVDSDGNATPSLMERVTGVISGSNLTVSLRGQDNTTAKSHSNGAVVEDIWEADGWNDAVDAFLTEHNQDGTHAATIVKTTGSQTISGAKTFSTAPLLTFGSEAQGDVFYSASDGTLTRLAPGTNGQYLKTQGAGANPTWSTVVAGDSRISVVLNALNAAFPDSNFAALNKTSGTNWVYNTLDFDPGTDEAVYWTVVIPSDLTPASAKLRLYWTATSGTAAQLAYWQVTTRTPTDDEVIDATTTPNSATDSGNDALIATGDVHILEITLTTTGWAAGDMLQIKLNRDADNGSDNLSGDAKLIQAILEVRQ